ncbi:MAG TPA: hypothetical protein VL306_02135 [Methylomirabilota bacterium]|nr:hypothetical protein [Methylomirabilota bacterium]
MKQNTNTKTKKVSVSKTKKTKIKTYPSHYLAIAIIATLFVEGMLIGSAHAADWQQGSSILDMTAGISQTTQDTLDIFQPVIEVAQDVNEFYQQSATEMTKLLDLSGSVSDLSEATDGIAEFYNQAATQMTDLLDVSNVSTWPAIVSGISIERH